LNIDDKPFKHCFNIYKNHYRLKRLLQGQSEWCEHRAGKITLETLINEGMKSGGTKFKPYPYEFYYLHVIKWIFIKYLNKSYKQIKNILTKASKNPIITLIGFVLSFIGFNELKSCVKKISKEQNVEQNVLIPSSQELQKQAEIDSLENYQFQDSINTERPNLKTDKNALNN
jgi:hypothetical protein